MNLCTGIENATPALKIERKTPDAFYDRISKKFRFYKMYTKTVKIVISYVDRTQKYVLIINGLTLSGLILYFKRYKPWKFRQHPQKFVFRSIYLARNE